MGLSELKKSESRLRTAGEEGIFCNVSMVLSDKEGRDLLPNCWLFRNRSLRILSPNFSLPSPKSGRTSSCSRRTSFEGFLINRALLLDFRKGRLEGWTTVPFELSRSRGIAGTGARGDSFVAEADNWSRLGALRKRGLSILLTLGGCWRFSLETDGRTPARGTGSLETNRGIPLGLVLVD